MDLAGEDLLVVMSTTTAMMILLLELLEGHYKVVFIYITVDQRNKTK